MATAAYGAEYSHFFEVRLPVFNGPIDLLLHLVKQRELPIEKVALAEVASQYLQCVEIMRHFDLDIAGEYLVIAATLLSIKSCVLLNKPVELIEDEDGNLLDPHEELLRKLREAKLFRDSVAALNQRQLLNFDVFASPGTLDGVDAPPISYQPHDAWLLGQAFRKMLDRCGQEQAVLSIAVDQVSVVERMISIIDFLRKQGSWVEFENLIPSPPSRLSLIASFVALLELCKRQVIELRQEDIGGRISVALVSGFGADDLDELELSSEFDTEQSVEKEKKAGASV